MVASALKLEKKKAMPALTGDKLVRQGELLPGQLPVEAHDVQGIVFRGYGHLPACCYPLLQIGDPARARGFLRALCDRVARGVPAAQEVAVHAAFTHAGLRALGLPEDVLQGFAREFIAGMTGPHKSRFLGDVDASAPEHWQWGGPSNPEVHAVLIVLAHSQARLDALLGDLRAAWTAAGLTELRTLTTAELTPSATEHFGFADGISQPAIDGYHPAPSDLHLVKAGEFVLGYENEYGLYTERPMLPAARDPFALLPLDVEGSPRHDLGRNGTYLVFRQLRQDVVAFRNTVDALTRKDDGSPDPHARDLLAAQMVGRWPSGASLIDAPYGDDPSKADQNEFRYHREDPDGMKCPIGAHVRRANPRDALAPHPGTEQSLDVNRRHRLIRRGRVYGPQLPEGAPDDGVDRGLIFVAVNANITRQFEFVQHSWLIDPRFNGLYEEADPIMGALSSNTFAAPGNPVRARCTGLPRFVTVTGGSYFFMPGVRALRYLAESTPEAVSP
jgi:Dyp-type peroxidase family